MLPFKKDATTSGFQTAVVSGFVLKAELTARVFSKFYAFP
jgi:hypothetical protein